MRILFLIILVSLLGCNSGPIKTHNEKMYRAYKSKFNSNFINHFPGILTTPNLNMSCNTYGRKNDVGFLLYEYDLASDKLDAIEMNTKRKYIAKYKSSDTCLMIVNRFETKETYENLEQPTVSDSSLINRPCYNNQYPIPNFISYESDSLGKNFIIYVLEAKPISIWKDEKLEPSIFMPAKWKNGYSKGVALNKENGTVIYWAITW